jgi:hypothetical protein
MFCTFNPTQSRAMTHAVRQRPLTMEARVSVHVGFLVLNVTLGQVFLRVLRFTPVKIIGPWF